MTEKRNDNDSKQLIRAFSMGGKSMFDDENLTIRGVVISSDALDSYNTRIIPDGVILDRFATNAPLLYNHDSFGDPIGRVENVRVEGNELLADVVLTKIGGQGEKIYGWLKEKTLNAFSVRFESIASHSETIDGDEIVIYDQWRLLEVSVVNIPANPDAVVKRSLQSEREKESVRALVQAEFARLKSEDEAKTKAKVEAEAQRTQLSTDLIAALKGAYKGIGKTLAEAKK